MSATKVKTRCIMARIVGYYRPLDVWNKGKVQEMKDRKTVKFEK